MPEKIEIKRKRLLYQAQHRGTQEGDLIMGGFAERYINQLDAPDLDAFEALVNEPDAEIMDWISARADIPKAHKGPVIDMIINFKIAISSN
ncbi:MAG: succinate dehydrogenase assembly factor 2 [Rhodospirillales bacterium]|nr:succinate dehydrogenase assembly factor 2 [Rhodospirillales bacterium]MBT4006082.1 succinate dehydrogenase assembly factor 2 [Rhodospirillales bacterium]MBT5077107.1 succinate dehydrogenase assembly factor 2 [Rhodospirillales bacterium]MBT5112825.1 succinate dehydrogenase assembly factor 2 [Rhodospirillales bacterium]MBT5673595.1 succinate dehydrogenase assembly factor 2 [Rhodospirillales bacterium]